MNTQETQKKSILDVELLENISNIIPLSCTINDFHLTIRKNKWQLLFIDFFEYLIRTKNVCLVELENELSCRGKKILLSNQVYHGTCAKLTNKKWVYLGISSIEIIEIIQEIYMLCELDEFTITFEEKIRTSNEKKIVHTNSDETQNQNEEYQKTIISKDGIAYYDLKLDKINASVRAKNCLRSMGIKYFSEILPLTVGDLMSVKNMGSKTISEILELKDIIQLKNVPDKELQGVDLSTNLIKHIKEEKKFNIRGKTYIDKDVNNVNFSVRAQNCLKALGIKYMSEVLKLTNDDVLKTDHVGNKTIEEILNSKMDFEFVPATNEDDLLRKTISKVIKNVNDKKYFDIDLAYSEIYSFLEENLFEILVQKIISHTCIKSHLKEYLCSLLQEFSFGCGDLTALRTKMPEFCLSENFLEGLLEELISEQKIYYEDDKYFLKLPSIFDICHDILSTKCCEVFFSRLEGKTLEDIGSGYGVTRERIRQIEKKSLEKFIQTGVKYQEDIYAQFYSKYEISQNNFEIAFGENEKTYNYLKLRYEKGDLPFEQLIFDAEIPHKVKQNLVNFSRNEYSNTSSLLQVNYIRNFENHKKLFLFIQSTQNNIFNHNLIESSSEVIKKYFSNGFKLKSPIELHRFKKFFSDCFNIDLPDSDIDLNHLILSSGVLFDEKIYSLEADTFIKIEESINKLRTKNMDVLYYDQLFLAYEDWLQVEGVVSASMFKELLCIIYPKYFYKKNYFSFEVEFESERKAIKSELIRIWKNNTTLSYAEITNLLPFIPIEKIKITLTDESDFIWNSQEVYAFIGNFVITDEDCLAIRNNVRIACEKDGFSSFLDIYPDNILEENFELSIFAIQSAIFEKCLSHTYKRKGRLIVAINDDIDIHSIMTAYFSTQDRLSLQELYNFEKELTGEIYHWPALKAAYEVMVRVQKDTFVAFKYVNFDVLETDIILDSLISNNYAPLKSIVAFSIFPDCYHAWNSYVLESFCRNYSKKFRFDTVMPNSRNAGVIIRISCTWSYFEILADAVARAGIELQQDTALAFLAENGYIARRSYSKINELLALANTLRYKES